MVIPLAIAWIACAIIAFSNHTLGMLLLWSIPIPGVMVPFLWWMRWYHHDEPHAAAVPRPRRSPRPSARQRHAVLQPLPRLPRQLAITRRAAISQPQHRSTI